jgi:hypothetical protein
MLNIQDIINRVNEPAMCTTNDLDDLRLMADKFPYSQIFPILYLKALSNRRDIRFDEELSKYAYRISDRAQLYKLIHEANDTSFANPSEVLFVEKESATVDSTVDEPIETWSETLIDQLETTSDPHPESTVEETDPHLREKSGQSNEEIGTSDENDETEEEELIPLNIRGKDDIETQVFQNTDHKDPFEREILAETISTSFELTLTRESKTSDDAPSESLIESQGISSEENQIEQKRSFSSWLRSNMQNDHEIIDEEKARIDSILEKFLEEQPSISRPNQIETEDKPKKEFFSAAKKAKESIQPENMPVSETLARIFELQGNYPKAIFVYEQLVLTNPEKKTFFASQIQSLKKKITT